MDELLEVYENIKEMESELEKTLSIANFMVNK